MTTTTIFNGKTLEVLEEFPLTPLLAAEKLTSQKGVRSSKGTEGLMQEFKGGHRRVIWLSKTGMPRTENQRAA